jgi:hypothetical protein
MDEQAQLGASKNGSVVLDIGGEIGALVLYTSAELHLSEIEISPVSPDDVDHHEHSHDHDQGHDHHHAGRTHVAVRERRGPAGIQYAAIFFGLQQGDYILWGLDGSAADRVRIVGGTVAELDWR